MSGIYNIFDRVVDAMHYALDTAIDYCTPPEDKKSVPVSTQPLKSKPIPKEVPFEFDEPNITPLDYKLAPTPKSTTQLYSQPEPVSMNSIRLLKGPPHLSEQDASADLSKRHRKGQLLRWKPMLWGEKFHAGTHHPLPSKREFLKTISAFSKTHNPPSNAVELKSWNETYRAYREALQTQASMLQYDVTPLLDLVRRLAFYNGASEELERLVDKPETVDDFKAEILALVVDRLAQNLKSPSTALVDLQEQIQNLFVSKCLIPFAKAASSKHLFIPFLLKEVRSLEVVETGQFDPTDETEAIKELVRRIYEPVHEFIIDHYITGKTYEEVQFSLQQVELNIIMNLNTGIKAENLVPDNFRAELGSLLTKLQNLQLLHKQTFNTPLAEIDREIHASFTPEALFKQGMAKLAYFNHFSPDSQKTKSLLAVMKVFHELVRVPLPEDEEALLR